MTGLHPEQNRRAFENRALGFDHVFKVQRMYIMPVIPLAGIIHQEILCHSSDLVPVLSVRYMLPTSNQLPTITVITFDTAPTNAGMLSSCTAYLNSNKFANIMTRIPSATILLYY